MRIIIPMTGHGSRFKSAGYSKLKPFIRVHGKPILFWVCKMFPNYKIEIIIRDFHAKKYSYVVREIKKFCKNIEIHKVKSWKKKGPAYDVCNYLNKDNRLQEPVMVSYCDFYALWDIEKFNKLIKKNDPDGVIPCYTGFHPHLLHPENLYATCKSDKNHKMIKIQEKHQMHACKFNDLTSPGLYYFKTGELCKKYCNKLINSKQSINNEYYMSLPFNFMVQDNLTVLTPPIVNFFCQWGTPADLEEYIFWNTKSFLKNYD